MPTPDRPPPERILQRNHVTVSGHGEQPIVFAHGFGCDQRMWRFVAPAFEDRFKIVLFDYVGFGRSELSAFDPARYNSLEGFADDLLEVCDALDLERVIVVGHSVSAMISVLAAIERPELFEKLILIGPSPRYIDEAGYRGGFSREDIVGLLDLMDKNYIGWGAALAGMVMKNPDRPELASELAEVFCSTDPKAARNFAEVTFFGDNREDLGKVATPALIMQCSDDSIAPDQVGQFVNDRLANSTLKRLAATGHCPQLSHPEETVRVIREFIGA
jgi:sigma-B regulation protein RsbQ